MLAEVPLFGRGCQSNANDLQRFPGQFRKLVRAVALALIPTHEDIGDGDSTIPN